MADVATHHHDIGEHEIQGGEDVPADDKPRWQPQCTGQQQERDDADRKRDEGARPAIDHANRQRQIAEPNKVFFEFLVHPAPL
jgi:hypothetical protein